jgi:DNA-binding NarL/FixJ family response regulator
MKPEARISVVLADDHTVVRQGLMALLRAEDDMDVVGEAADGEQAVALAKKKSPDVVVMDLAMPIMSGLAATIQILAAVPETKVLVLSSYSEQDCVDELMAAGATGFLMKQTASAELSQAIRNVRRGIQTVSPAIAQRMRHQRQAGFAGGNSKPAHLTVRELEVLKLIATGFSNREAAASLGISIKTIEKHRQQVMSKLNIHETAGLTRYALSRNLLAA